MIRQGSQLAFSGWTHASDIRLTVKRYDAETDTYHLETTRALRDWQVERCIVHAWLRRKVLLLERKGPKI